MGPHRGMAIFKRFAALNARSLLYQQAELLDLEAGLEAHTEADRQAGMPFHRNAMALLDARNDSVNGRQWGLIKEVREKLKEYSMYKSQPRLEDNGTNGSKMRRCFNKCKSTALTGPICTILACSKSGLPESTVEIIFSPVLKTSHGETKK